MARITVEGCLDKVQSRFELILLAAGRARQLSTTSREPMVEWEDDKSTIVALREIEEGLITKEILDKTLEEDLLLDEFAIDREKPQDEIIG
jgi:DNA-directed RNA polymerase subunit omega|tara:strand:- start:7823 stop:8095 length:273 start_codon:yes stop_codon:yes gene_type:complete